MAVKYEDIAKANESIATITMTRENKKTGEVTSKEYAEVNQRIKAFRMVYPTGTIRTSIVSLDKGVVTMQTIVEADGIVLGTGYAQEKEGSTFINQTSFIENCETSAVGRALGMCGFGIDTSVASYEEVANAQQNQKPKEPRMATDKQIGLIINLYAKNEIMTMLKRMKKADLKELTIEEASKMIASRGGE